MRKVSCGFDSNKTKNFQSWDDLSKELFSSEEIKDMEFRAEERSKMRNELSNEVSIILTQYMSDNKIGFNELVRRLHMSTATVSKIIKGSSNITLDTIAEIGALIGRRIYIDVH